MHKSRSGIDTSHLACYHSFTIVPQTETQNAGKEMVNMKRLIALLLAAALAFSLVACGGGGESEQRDAILTITKSDGTEETITSEELMDIHDENEINYNNNYMGCTAIVEGYVTEVEQGREEIFNNIWADTVEITLESDSTITGITFFLVLEDNSYENIDFSTITTGTKIRVTGDIGEYHVDLKLDNARDFEILTED